MSLVLRPPTDRVSLTGRLAALGHARRVALVTRGFCCFAAFAGFAVAAAGALDAAVHLPAVARAFLLGGTLAGAGVLWLRGVVRGLREPVHPLAVALLLEEKYPRLNDALASAVEFATAGAGDRFRRISVARAENLAERHDFTAIVPSGPAWRAFWIAVCVGATVAALALTDTARAKTAAVRLADPFGNHSWPAKTVVELAAPVPTRLAKGDPFDVRFTVRGVVPGSATVSVRIAGSAAGDEVVPLTPADANPAEAVADVRLDAGRVARDFEFRVTANDGDSGWHAVAVSPPPKLVPLDGRPSPQVSLAFPAYTDLPPASLPDGTGVVECVAGTRVTFRAATDLKVATAVFRPAGDPTAAHAAAALSRTIGGSPLAPVAARLLADAATADIPVRVSADGTRLDATFTPRLPGLYALRLTGDDGLTGTRMFSFQVFPDPAPVVALTRPDPARDPLTLLPTAAVPLETRAEDRTFAVRTLAIEYRVGPAGEFRTLPLADLTAARPLVAVVAGPAAFVALDKPVALEAARAVPLAALVRPDGTAPRDGDVITLRTVARDWDDVHLTKDPGRSKDVEIRVLGKPSLDALLQKELAAMRPELLRIREEQRAAREAVADAKAAADAGKVPPEAAGKLATAEQTQRELRHRVADPTDGLRARADRLKQAAKANALPRSPTTERVEGVANDLNRLADQQLETAEPQVAVARQEADTSAAPGSKSDPKKLADLLGKAAATQRAAEATLDAVLERLEQWGGAAEVRGQAKNLKDQLQKIGDDAAKLAEKVPAKPADDLTPAQKADLAAAADKLDQAAEQAAALVAKAARLAADKAAQADGLKPAADDRRKEAAEADAEAAKLPADSPKADRLKAKAADLRAQADALDAAAARAKGEADTLKQAVQNAGGQAVPDDLRAAAAALRDNKPGQSAAARGSAADRLERFANGLAEQPTATGDELAKKRKDAAGELDQLAAEQDELRKKAKAAAAEPDPAKRADELKKLAKEQEQLRRKAEALAQKLTRDKADRAAAAVRRAAEEQAAARDQLDDGKSPAPQQDDALEKFDEALQKLEAEEKQAADELSREKKEQLADQLKAIRDRQKAAAVEAVRLGFAAASAKGWTRPLLASLTDLEDRQKNLAGEVRGFADKKLADLPVFRKLATQAAAAMDRAARAAAERKDDALADAAAPFDPAADKVAHERVVRPTTTALRRLDQILDALKDEPKPQAAKGKDPKPAPGGDAPPGGENAPAAGEPPGVPQLAQLKALRAVQAEVNQQTAAFAEAHPDPTKLTDDEKDELKELEQTQREIAELFDQLAPALRPGEALP